MSLKLVFAVGIMGLPIAIQFTQAQVSTLPERSLQPSEARQPTKSTAPPLRGQQPLDRSPRLTDPATDEDGQPLVDTDLTTRPRTSAALRRQDPDLVMATWVALENHQQLALSEIAAQRASHDQVREFAKVLADDHIAFQELLKPFAPRAVDQSYVSTTVRDVETRETTEREVVREAKPEVNRLSKPAVATKIDSSKPIDPDAVIDDTAAARPNANTETNTLASASMDRDFDLVQVDRELAAQSLASSRKALDQARGVDFDREFLMQQIALHKSMRDKMIVYQRHVSGPLSDILANGERACEEHVMKAHELLRAVAQMSNAGTKTPAE